MSNGAHSIDDLTGIYMSQSVGAFTVLANAAKEPNNHEQRVDKGPHDGNTPCSDSYSCCTDDCCDKKCGALCVLVLVGGCICCCYVTHGFGGVWTYWPF
jgi:hypothetical protein